MTHARLLRAASAMIPTVIIALAMSGCAILSSPSTSTAPDSSPATPEPPRPAPSPTPVTWPALRECKAAEPVGMKRAGVGIIATTCRIPGTQNYGVYVHRLGSIKGRESPARNLLEPGDRIVAINRCLVTSSGQLDRFIRGLPQDFEPEFLVIRRDIRLSPLRIDTVQWIEEAPEVNQRLKEASDESAKCTSLGLQK